MRALLALLLVLGCDRGPRAEPTAPPPPAPAPAVAAPPKRPHVIDHEVGGLGSWKGNAVTGIMWHVAIDLDKATISITDPGGARRQHALGADETTRYATLAQAVAAAPPYTPANSCTDRTETLRIDDLVLADSCPIAQRDAAALIATFLRELE